MRALLVLILLLLPALPARAQEGGDEKPIQDNSFLLEEAYNQEFGVVQHISAFQYNWPAGDWGYGFTQEWPVDIAPRHQLSYTLSALRPGSGLEAGFGDLALNWRYQLVGSGDAKVAFAPRVSLLLSTGDSRRGLGAGATGVQVNLPVSVQHNRRLVTHWNAGATFHPNAKNELDHEAATRGVNLGQSFVWLAHPRFNVLLETVYYSAESVVAPQTTEREHAVFLNPGVRWAWDLPNGLQIVPGVAVPVGVGPSAGERGVFFYLSLEHPYRKLKDTK